jgi:hypothetical protein
MMLSAPSTLLRTGFFVGFSRYCACKKCCGKFADGITACGHKIRRGDTFVAADQAPSVPTALTHVDESTLKTTSFVLTMGRGIILSTID